MKNNRLVCLKFFFIMLSSPAFSADKINIGVYQSKALDALITNYLLDKYPNIMSDDKKIKLKSDLDSRINDMQFLASKETETCLVNNVRSYQNVYAGDFSISEAKDIRRQNEALQYDDGYNEKVKDCVKKAAFMVRQTTEYSNAVSDSEVIAKFNAHVLTLNDIKNDLKKSKMKEYMANSKKHSVVMISDDKNINLFYGDEDKVYVEDATEDIFGFLSKKIEGGEFSIASADFDSRFNKNMENESKKSDQLFYLFNKSK